MICITNTYDVYFRHALSEEARAIFYYFEVFEAAFEAFWGPVEVYFKAEARAKWPPYPLSVRAWFTYDVQLRTKLVFVLHPLLQCS